MVEAARVQAEEVRRKTAEEEVARKKEAEEEAARTKAEAAEAARKKAAEEAAAQQKAAEEKKAADAEAARIKKLKLTETEVRRCHAIFNQLDEDGSGAVSTEEICFLAQSDKEAMMAVLDVDEDGTVRGGVRGTTNRRA